MAKLIQSNFSRLWKAKSFWVCVIIAVAMSLPNLLNDVVNNTPWTLGGFIITRIGIDALLFAPIFASLFLGTEYANGTIRNKLAVGHSRITVYFSNLITVFSGCLLMLAFYCVLPTAIGVIQGVKFGVKIDDFMLKIAIIIAAAAALASILTLLGMLISSKSLTTTITIVLSFVMFIGSMVILQFLEEPEYYSGITIADDGTEHYVEDEPNPMYIKPGLKRDIFTVITNVTPYGQCIRLVADETKNPEQYLLYSLGVITVTTTAGVLVFRRKDLK